MTDYLYRAFAKVRWEDRDFRDPKAHTTVYVDKLTILRRTPKGAWILHPVRCTETWVSTVPGRKRFAYPTREEAMESLKQRTRRRIAFLQRDIDVATATNIALLDGEYETLDLVSGRVSLD